jgi:arylformamidase
LVVRKPVINPEAITEKIKYPRVLFRTDSFDPNNWQDSFSFISSQCVNFLNKKGVELVGIDTPSVDRADSKNLPSHRAFLKNRMSILEGLDLRMVEAGDYELIALPLKWEGVEAAPVRAVLRPLS